LQTPSDTIGIPNEYFGDYIHINKSQEKTITYIFLIQEDASLQYHTFPLYGIDTYDFNQTEMRFHKSTHNLENLNYTMTITKNNFSYTIHPHQNTSMSFDFSGIPGFFPLVNNDVVNFTYRLDTHNLSSEFNQTIFIMPFKPHSEYLGNLVRPEQTTDTPIIDFTGFITIVISISVSLSILSVVYVFYQQYQRQRERSHFDNHYWQDYLRQTTPPTPTQTQTEQRPPSNSNLPSNYADYHYERATDREHLLQWIDTYRDSGYWTKVVNISPTTSVIYLSNWKQENVAERGIPQWRKPRQQN
jgi:hypothetical protein